VQAAGATMLNPVAMAIIANTFPVPAERAKAIGVFGSMSGLALALGPIVGGALVDGFGWHSIFWINVPIVLVAFVLATRYVPESHAPRTRRFDPVGQLLVIVVLGSVVYAVIESNRRGWTSPLIAGLLVVAALAAVSLVAYETRRTDPLLELRLLRSVPFSSSILMALFALCAFSSFLFVTTLYLQHVRGMSALTAGLSLLPVGALIALLSPYTGKMVGDRGPRLPLLVSGTALALGGLLSLLIGPATSLIAVLAIYLLFGVFQGTINPPITNTAVSGMPRSMAGVATSLASAGRQTGTTLGVAIAGTILGSVSDGTSFTGSARAVWWLVFGLGVGVVALGLLSTGPWAKGTAERAAALFEEIEGTAPAASGRPEMVAGWR
jgi:MFS family permease